MSTRREPSPPPDIPGYTFQRVLGMGGFADVFLYEQRAPRRLVAVKVLLAASLVGPERSQFQHEADLMARLSHHPSIVTILHADVAPDGRPFLVMEYCSRPGLGRRYRAERISVAEALRIGVRLSCAVETAHRAGILHRDIKPANVLVTDFGWPALTDFGIAATTTGPQDGAVGMSIPWSGPELFGDPPVADVRSDVYGLAATVYSVLAGRSPFELGTSTSPAQLISRIERAPLVPVGRADVPEALEQVLARAMAKAPERRHGLAAALARDLQAVELALQLAPTPLDLPDDQDRAGDVGDAAVGTWPAGHDEATRVRPVTSIDPAPSRVPTDPATPGSGPRPLVTQAPARPSTGRRAALVGAGVLVSALVVTGAVLVAQGVVAEPIAAPSPGFVAPSGPTLGGAVPTPVELDAERQADGAIVLQWENPDPQDGDSYVWAVVRPGTTPQRQVVNETEVRVDAADQPEDAAEVCVEVSLRRADGRASTRPATECVP